MALVKIYSLNGIEIEYKKDSLTLKKENNSLSSDFKVPHSSFPFLVIENEQTKKALGSADITSIRKNKIIPVIILENGVRYYGELQQLTVIQNFRKCNLKYGSDVLKVINKKIAEFMPVVSVIPGETNPIPYVEETEDVILGSENWESFPVGFMGKVFPEVKFNFPTLSWFDKFGIDLLDGDEWFSYLGHINLFTEEEDKFVLNSYEFAGSVFSNSNKNVVSPQIFLLSPLFYIFQSIDWKIKGDFYTNPFVNRLLLLSFKNNLTKCFLEISAEAPLVFNPLSLPGSDHYRRSNLSISSSTPTKYYFIIRFEEPMFTNPDPLIADRRLYFGFNGAFVYRYIHPKNAPAKVYEASFVINVNQIDSFLSPIVITYRSDINTFPTYAVTYRAVSLDNTYQQMHPTIELGRYVPEWTVGNYLNYIKNQFNLDITLDDFKKEITLNLNENIDDYEQPSIISKSLINDSYDLAANSSFVLKYQNDEDFALFINREEAIAYDGSKDTFTEIISSNFKFVPRNTYTSVLSDELNKREGVGLMIYEEDLAPYSAEKYNGFNLSIQGEKGIYETFFRRWLKFRLNASVCQITGYFTEIEINLINKAKSVYVNNQRFRLIDIETTEASNNYQEVKMKIASVNF